MSDATRPDIPAVPAACPASTPADGIMVSCEVDGDHERHRGTYVHELAGEAWADAEVSWLTDEPADAVADAGAPAVTSPAPAPAGRPGTATGPAGRVQEDAAKARTLLSGVLLDELARRVLDYENAITWDTSCLSCSRVLDSAYEETMRREAAEAKLAVIATWARHGGAVDSTAILAVAAAETPAELAALGGGEASVPLRTSEQWAVAWGSQDATKARVEHYDDEEDAAERLGLYGDGAYVVSREVRWGPWRRALAAGTGQEPLSATCTGPDCGEQFADSETGEYLFASRERMERLLYADGWAADPVLCPACQQEPPS